MGIELFWGCRKRGEPRAGEAGTGVEHPRWCFEIRIEHVLRARLGDGIAPLGVALPQPE
jgi:hypothetical protein